MNKKEGRIRYMAYVMFKNVPGRIAALALERSLVCAYFNRKGRNPSNVSLPRDYFIGIPAKK